MIMDKRFNNIKLPILSELIYGFTIFPIKIATHFLLGKYCQTDSNIYMTKNVKLPDENMRE